MRTYRSSSVDIGASRHRPSHSHSAPRTSHLAPRTSPDLAPRTSHLAPRPHRQHAAAPAHRIRRDDRPRRRALREGGVAEPGRLGEGSRGRADDCSRARRSGALHAGRHDPRRDVGQHRHRLRDGRRGARLPREAVRAGERHARAQADPARLRRRARPDRSARGHRRRDPRGAAAATPSDPDRYFYPDQYNNDAQLARALRHDRRPRSSSRPSGRLTHFVAGLGTSGTFVGTGAPAARVQPGDQADLVPARRPAPRPRRAEAHGVGDRAGHLRPDARRRGPARRHRATPTRWCGGWRARKACWSASRRGAALAATLRGRAARSSAASIVTVFPDGGGEAT